MTLPFTASAVHAAVEVSHSAISTPSAALPVTAAANPTPAFLAAAHAVKAPSPRKALQIIHGLASWYGGVFNGRKTANGETFDSNLLTACHPTLPFGSLVRVINRSNKRSVVVRINDRGDLVNDGRVIDLSKAAADKLSMTGRGVARVDLEVLSMGKPVDAR